MVEGAHPRRPYRARILRLALRGWGDLGADVDAADGGLRIVAVRPGSVSERLGLRTGDLLVVLAGAPVSTHDDLVTVLRVIRTLTGEIRAEWVRDGTVHKAKATA